jgi:hypothetical protein
MAKPKAAALFEDGELADAPDSLVQSAQDCYNETAKGLPWRQSTSLTEARKTALRRAVKDYGGLVGFRAAMVRAAKSPFLLGHTGRTGAFHNWKPTLAFFCQPKSIENLLDGVYDPEPEAPKRLHLPTVGFKPPHLKNMPAFVPEPREVRLAAMIASYRKHGDYQRANKIEEELAALENRSPVLVPAPDVAWVTAPAASNEKARGYRTGTDRPKPSAPVTDVPDWSDGFIPEGSDGEEE